MAAKTGSFGDYCGHEALGHPWRTYNSAIEYPSEREVGRKDHSDEERQGFKHGTKRIANRNKISNMIYKVTFGILIRSANSMKVLYK